MCRFTEGNAKAGSTHLAHAHPPPAQPPLLPSESSQFRGCRAASSLPRCWTKSSEFPAEGRGPQGMSELKLGQLTVALDPALR